MADQIKGKALPMQQTLLLLNNFITNTVVFLNTFAETCENKITVVSGKINIIEVTLAVLEAKLNSIPGLDGTAPPPSSDNKSSSTPSTSGSSPAPPSSSGPAAASAPSEPAAASSAAAPAAAVASGPPAGMIAVKDHPDYVGFFKFIRLGVPMPVVIAKIEAAGLDPSAIDDPERLVPYEQQSIAGLD